MNLLVIVDTDILIDVGRGDSESIRFLEGMEETTALAVSAITQMELIVGCQSKKELLAIEQFLERFEILPVDENITNTAVDLLKRYRLSHGLLIADAIIAATGILHEWPFVSKNQKDYRFVENLKLLAHPH